MAHRCPASGCFFDSPCSAQTNPASPEGPTRLVLHLSSVPANGQTVVLAAAVESPQTKLERLVLLTARVERIGQVAPAVNNH